MREKKAKQMKERLMEEKTPEEVDSSDEDDDKEEFTWYQMDDEDAYFAVGTKSKTFFKAGD